MQQETKAPGLHTYRVDDDKPRRPRRRRSRLAYGLAIVTLGIGGAAIYAGTQLLSFRSRPPEQDYNAQLHELALRLAGPEAQGKPTRWPQYLAALEAMRTRILAIPGAQRPAQANAYEDVFTPAMARDLPRDDEARQLADRVSAAMMQPEMLDLLDQAHDGRVVLVLPQFTGDLLTADRSDLTEARHLARCLAFELSIALRRGEHDRALAMWRRSLTLSRVYVRDPLLIGHLVGNAMLSYPMQRLRDEMQAGHIPPAATLRAMLDELASVRMPDIDGVLEGERLIALDAIQRLPSTWVSWLRFSNPGVQSAAINDFYDQLGKTKNEATALARHHAMARVTDEVEQRQNGEWVRGVADMLLPAMTKAFASNTMLRADLAGTSTMIALQLHHMHHGAFPATLAALQADPPVVLPVDPYSPSGLRYRLFAPGEDAHGRAYLLYSVALDGLDNDGRQMGNDASRYRAFSASGAGYDFVINQPADAGPQ